MRLYVALQKPLLNSTVEQTLSFIKERVLSLSYSEQGWYVNPIKEPTPPKCS